MHSPTFQNRTFLLLLTGVTVAFLAILWPFYGAVFWAVVLAILFLPLHRRLLARLPGRPNLAALGTLGLCLLLVILPLMLLSISLVQETAQLYERARSGQLNFGLYAQQILATLPEWAHRLLAHFHISSLAELQDKFSSAALQASQWFASKILSIGQNTLGFIVSACIMLYLLFFLLRDGVALGQRIRNAIPLNEAHKRNLSSKFATVVRATVKGNIVVAAAQGALGGLIFWVLGIQAPVFWGVLMAFLSLLPAVGASLIWMPVALYFFATGALWQGAVLTGFGMFVIGLVDNLLRPLLVGKDTKLPDYMVLISTLGGMSLFGLTGFVIGPVIAALFVAVWDLFASTPHEHTD